MKEETGFKLEEIPIKKKLRKADLIITNLMKKQALFALKRCWMLIKWFVYIRYSQISIIETKMFRFNL